MFLRFLGLVLACCSVLPAQEDGGDPRLAGAIRQIFRGNNEGVIREGVRTCLRVGDAKAMAVLVKGLEAPNPHLRDLVWEVMPDFTDIYARRRVAEELRSNKDEGVRHWCAEVLGIWGEADWMPFLVGALRDKDVEVVRAAARSLGMLRLPDGCKQLVPLAKHKDAKVRANAIEALARLTPAEHVPLLRAGLGDADGGVRCALLAAAAAILPGEVEALSHAALTDVDWRPRMQAIDNLGKLRTPGAIRGLIAGLQDGRPAVRARALRFLQELTTQRYRKHVEWNAWWEQNAATFAFAESKAAGGASASAQASASAATANETVASFHGVRIESDHCVFLIDGTPSMGTALPAGGTKQTAAAAEFEAALSRLADSELTFNVAVYDEKLDTLFKVAEPLTKKRLGSALKFVRAAKLSGAKDIWNALSTIVGDATVDTIVLLSSGEPEVGRYVHWNRVTRHLAELNRFHKVVVHTVAYSDVEWYLEQLRHIAEATGGTCKEVK